MSIVAGCVSYLNKAHLILYKLFVNEVVMFVWRNLINGAISETKKVGPNNELMMVESISEQHLGPTRGGHYSEVVL